MEPILHHPDERCKFIIKIDESDTAMAAVMLQEGEDGCLHPCAYVSKIHYYGEKFVGMGQGGSGCKTCSLPLVLPAGGSPLKYGEIIRT